MAAVASQPLLDTPQRTMHEVPSHANVNPDGAGPGPVPFPRQRDEGESAHAGVVNGSRQPCITIDSPRATTPSALPSTRTEVSPAASLGHTMEDQTVSGRTSGALAETTRVQSSLPPQAYRVPRTKDDDLPPLPAAELDPTPSSSSLGLFRRITRKLHSPTNPTTEETAIPPSAFQISLPFRSRSRSRSRSRARPDTTGDADAAQPQPQLTRRKSRLPAVVIPKAPAPALPASFTSPQQRQAALRARGLVSAGPHTPRYRDAHGYWMSLSEQEKELDRMFAVVVDEGRTPSGEDEETEAKKFRDAWLAQHRSGQDAETRVDEKAAGDESTTALRRATVMAEPIAPAPEPSRHSRERSANVHRIATSASAQELRPSVDPSLPPPTFDGVEIRLARDRRSSDVSERVSRWLQSSLRPRPAAVHSAQGEGPKMFSLFQRRKSMDASIVTTPYLKESDARRSAEVSKRPPSTRSSVDSDAATHQLHSIRRSQARKLPPVPPSAFSPVKGILDPVVTTSPTDMSAPNSGVSPTHESFGTPVISINQPNSSRTSLDRADDPQNPKVRRVKVQRRGRSATTESSSSFVSSQNHLRQTPALSPTWSASSSEAGLPATPTTDTHGCDPPPPPPRHHLRATGSRNQHPTKQASQTSLGRSRTVTRGVYPSVRAEARGDARRDDDGDGDSDSDLDSFVQIGMEFGVRMQGEAQKMRDLMAAAATAGARPRPRRESAGSSERRKSLTLGVFSKKENLDVPPKFRNPRSASSMQNMKRAFSGTLASLKPRPKTTVEEGVHGEALSSPVSPALPPIPAAPPSSFRPALSVQTRRKTSAAAATQEQSPTPTKSSVGSGLRPRQALSPTIHDRGSILVEASRIEDDESRRLSEMAFLDY